ncbi:hypothetical protein NDU88_009176 [Pleurodeles waltl]|uniref:Uncharacterized protein n=1 Tax=Pleurodeles waltl TaxID=8319 RepID=A0AAV7P5R8_PLEWA|nr:hypothetical protein NDU88_009176 [Pleurodeles waltl]
MPREHTGVHAKVTVSKASVRCRSSRWVRPLSLGRRPATTGSLEGPERKPNRGPSTKIAPEHGALYKRALKRELPGTFDNTGDRAAKKKETRQKNREDCYSEEEAERDFIGPSSAESAEIHLGRSSTVTRPSSIQGVLQHPNGARRGPAKTDFVRNSTVRGPLWERRDPPVHKPGTAGEATRPGCTVAHSHSRGQPFGATRPVLGPKGVLGQPNGVRSSHEQSPGKQDSMEIVETNRELDLEEIIKAAREAATTRSKDWILKQIRGAGAGEEESSEARGGSSATNAAGSGITPPEPKKRQRNASRGARKGDKRETGETADAATPGPSKKAKTSNGEQISMIVQECLKSMVPLLFVKPGG